MTIPADTPLSLTDAMKAFRPWISAELLKSQLRWLVAESKSQQLNKVEILRRVLTAWVNNHPEERLTEPQLFNIMRAPVCPTSPSPNVPDNGPGNRSVVVSVGLKEILIGAPGVRSFVAIVCAHPIPEVTNSMSASLTRIFPRNW
jgi:hypothetical protein